MSVLDLQGMQEVRHGKKPGGGGGGGSVGSNASLTLCESNHASNASLLLCG
ncbi:MAG: hypothetical protein JWO56_3409 [Acidobacteria bacterium]|nr:hypothetical protein [Acidobacteriota bacterium]